MNYGYIRVSTDTQTTRNQEFEITRFCQSQGLSIDGWIEETISGQQAYNKRALEGFQAHAIGLINWIINRNRSKN